MKKKIISFAAASMLLLILAACGSAGENVALTPTATLTAEPTVEPTEIITPTPTPTEIPASREGDTYEKGVITENGFESEWMNLRFTLQSDMLMQSQAELDEEMRQDAGLGDNEPINYSELTVVTEMMAYYYTSGTNISVQSQFFPESGELYTIEEYIAYMEDVLNDLADSTVQVQISDDVYEVEFAGETYTGISITYDDGTADMLHQEYMIRKKEDRMITVIVTYSESCEEEAKRLMQSFGTFESEAIYLPEIFEPGILTEDGYENEWLDFRLAFPEGTTVKNLSAGDLIYLEIRWKGNIPIVGIIVKKAIDIEPTAEAAIADVKEDIILLSENEDVKYTFDEEPYVVKIGGQEYLDLVMQADEGNETIVYQEYCIREQDGYIISVVFSYTDGFETELMEAINAITAY